MGLGTKLFRSSFAGAASQPMLKQQEHDLAVLRDNLNNIAAQTRAETIQGMAGRQADARNRFSQGQQNLRNQLTQIGLNQRKAYDTRTRREEDAAELGIAGASFLTDNALMERIAQNQRDVRDADDAREAEKALFDYNTTILELEDKLDIKIDPEMLETPEGMARISQMSAEARAREELGTFDFDASMAQDIIDMGPLGADMIDSMLDSFDAEGHEIDINSRGRMLISRAAALNGGKGLEGFDKASELLKTYENNIIRRYFPGGDMPSTMDRQMDDDIDARYLAMQRALEDMHQDPGFANWLRNESGYSTMQVIGDAPVTEQYIRGRYESEQGQRADLEEDLARRNAMGLAFSPREDQVALFQQDLEMSAEQWAQASDIDSMEAAAFALEEAALKVGGADFQMVPGTESLLPEDYQAGADWLRQQIKSLQATMQAQMFQQTDPNRMAEVPRQGGMENPPGSPTPPSLNVRDMIDKFGPQIGQGR